MTTVSVAQRMTADQLLARPFEEGQRWQELIDGEIVVSRPTALHNAVQGKLFVALNNWISSPLLPGFTLTLDDPFAEPA